MKRLRSEYLFFRPGERGKLIQTPGEMILYVLVRVEKKGKIVRETLSHASDEWSFTLKRISIQESRERKKESYFQICDAVCQRTCAII